MATLLLACVLVFIGAFIQYSIGFGMAVVAAPLLFLLSPQFVPGPIVILALLISVLSAHEHRRNISFSGLKSAIIGRIPGSVLGLMFLNWADRDTLSLWLGCAVLLAVFISLLPWRIQPSPSRLALAGFLSGFMGTSTSIGGPPMALLLQHQQADYIRANLSAFFVVSSSISIVLLGLGGHLGVDELLITLPLIPMVLLAAMLSKRVHAYLNPKIFRYIALILCALSGLSAIVSSVL